MGEIFRHVLAVLPAFLLACLAVAALPGPSTALFLHRTVRDRRAARLAAVAGNEIGGCQPPETSPGHGQVSALPLAVSNSRVTGFPRTPSCIRPRRSGAASACPIAVRTATL